MDYGMPTLIELSTLEENAALCEGLGLRFVELNMNLPLCADVAHLSTDELRRLMDKYHLYFTLHLDERMDVCDFNPLVRSAYLETLRAAIRLAKEIGIPSLNLHMNPGIYLTLPDKKVYLYAEKEDTYRAALLAMRTLAEQEVGDTPLSINLENTNGFLPFAQRGIELLLESPLFGLTLDVGHLHAAGNVDAAFYDAHRSSLRHMHLHDASGRQNHLQLGTGQRDLKADLNLAQAQNCRVVVEVKTVQSLRASIDWLRANPL